MGIKICIEVLNHIGEVLVNFSFIFISLQSIIKAKFPFGSIGP